MMQDFPAAHSMDTSWFAVDADGNVGTFRSSENGAVPKTLKVPLRLEEFMEELPKDERGIVQLSVDGSLVSQNTSLEALWEDMEDEDMMFDPGDMMFDLILVLESKAVIDELIPDVCLQFSGSEVVVYVDGCSIEKVKNLIETGKILRGKPWFDLLNNAHIFGLFPFCHDFGAPAPYKRKNVPKNPLKTEELPLNLQQIVNQIHLDKVHFTETPEIQPIEHMECRTWRSDDWWLDTKRERAEWQEVGNAYDELDEEEEQE
jgi:hypothetical protein